VEFFELHFDLIFEFALRKNEGSFLVSVRNFLSIFFVHFFAYFFAYFSFIFEGSISQQVDKKYLCYFFF